jgi:hypothetical protein
VAIFWPGAGVILLFLLLLMWREVLVEGAFRKRPEPKSEDEQWDELMYAQGLKDGFGQGLTGAVLLLLLWLNGHFF